MVAIQVEEWSLQLLARAGEAVHHGRTDAVAHLAQQGERSAMRIALVQNNGLPQSNDLQRWRSGEQLRRARGEIAVVVGPVSPRHLTSGAATSFRSRSRASTSAS